MWYNSIMGEETLVEAAIIITQFNIPKSTLYRLVDQGKVRARRLPRAEYHQRRRFLFSPDEVAADLAKLPRPKA